MCFQVCVSVTRTQNLASLEEFNAVAHKLGIEMGEQATVELPKLNYVEELFQPGYLLDMGKIRQARIVQAQSLYTAAPYSVPKLNGSQSKDLEAILSQYVPAIEMACPEFKFDTGVAVSGELSIDFKSIIRPYDPEICHPADIGVLKPLTLIEGQIIHPVTSKLTL